MTRISVFFLLLAYCLWSACPKVPLEEVTLLPIAALPNEVSESSGLVYWQGSLWTHNDSGNSPFLYQFSPTDGHLISKVYVKGLSNQDWEELAQDEEYFYLGDFGNNNGDRKNLSIHRLAKDQVYSDSISGQSIFFDFPDQEDFSSQPRATDFDCEAMIATADELILFSKNYLNRKTRQYRLPKIPGNYQATLINEFDIGGLVTSAALDTERNQLYLLAYNKPADFDPFIWVFYDFCGSDFFGGQQEKIDLALTQQTEGLCFWEQKQFFLSCEGRNAGEEAFFSWDVGEWPK